MISLSGVSKTYGSQNTQPALSDISLTIEPGRMVAVVGPNGAGKSTLLGLLSGIIKPTTGEVIGAPIRSVVLQQTSLDHLLTIRENAELFARVYSVKRQLREKRIAEFAELAGLTDRLDDRVSTLSGGLARRADLLRAVMVGPELLILDEPTAGLDRSAAPEFMALLDTIRKQHNIGVVFVTHDLEEAEAADAVLVLKGGKAVAMGKPSELLSTLGSGTIFRVDQQGMPTIPGVRTLSKNTVLVEQANSERVSSELLSAGLPYSVRAVSLADAYDSIVGGEP